MPSDGPIQEVRPAAAILRDPSGAPDPQVNTAEGIDLPARVAALEAQLDTHLGLQDKVAELEATVGKIVDIAKKYFRQHFE